MKCIKWAALAAFVAAHASAHSLTFTAGSVYATSESAINQYSAQGALVSSLSTGVNDLRGLAFGPDGYLYVVHAGEPFSRQASVEVLREDGSSVRSYAFTGLVWGNTSLGKITFDNSGSSFYVGAGNGLYKFDAGGTAGSLYRNVAAFDQEVLPNGDMLVLTGSEVQRYSAAGTLISSFSAFTDPKGLTGGDPFLHITDARGIEYDPGTNTTYVTMLGYSGLVDMSFKLLAFDGTSNELKALENYWYGDDMFVSSPSTLLVGSRTQAPGTFTTALGYVGPFAGPAASFVTAMPVPEASTALMLAMGLGGVFIASARRRPA